jgi:hypothetical protein
MHGSVSRVAVAVVGLSIAAPVAQAQNLLPNGSFSDLFLLQGWSVSEGAIWSPVDVDEVPNSGSLRVSNTTPNTASGADSVCFPAEPDTVYRIAASVLWLDLESSADGRVQLRLHFRTGPNCTGGGFADGFSDAVEADSWQRVQALVAAPAGTVSASASLWNWRDGDSGIFISYFDDAEVVAVPEPEAGALALSAFTIVAAVACRRRIRCFGDVPRSDEGNAGRSIVQTTRSG